MLWIDSEDQNEVSSQSGFNLFVSEIQYFLKSSFDALDRLYKTDRPRVVGAVLNNSFQKGFE